MIKIGCFSNLPDPDNPGEFMDLEAFIRFVYEQNLDTVDFHLGKGFRSKEPDYLHRIKILCLKHGLPVGYVGSGGNFIGPEDVVARRMDQARADINVALAVGAPVVRLFGGSLPQGVTDRKPLWDQMIANFQTIADEAADKGVIIGLQNHDNRNLAATGKDVLAILNEVNRENFTCILDTGEWHGSIGASPLGEFDPEADIYGYMEEVAPYAAYIRAKFYKVDTGKEEWIDYARVTQILKTARFNGNISIVLQNQSDRCNDKDAVRLAARHLRDLLADPS